VARRLYWASLALTPIVLIADYGLHAGGTLLFILAAAALTPLAFLIGEATENVAEHTGSRVGGFLNASFGNAPELLIALFAINDGLPNVVRGTLTGSIVSTALVVLGAAIAFSGGGGVDKSSLQLQVLVLGTAVCMFLIPSIPGWTTGDPNSHGLYLLTLPVAALLLVVYVATTTVNLRKPSRPLEVEREKEPWSLRAAIAALTVATLATAFISEVLVGSLEAFVDQLGLSQFFVAAVIVALVGNAAEHGGAIVTARRGNSGLGAEIAVSSSTQVAVFVAPAIALLSGLVGRGLSLSFRPVEIVTMGCAAVAVAVVIADAKAKRWEGFALLGGYAIAVTAFWIAGDR
jgi:Ca2+:H+ antiporter